jgi:hypothetical protein
MKSEQEIRDKIKVWTDIINDTEDLSVNTEIAIMAKIFSLKWVLDEGPDI